MRVVTCAVAAGKGKRIREIRSRRMRVVTCSCWCREEDRRDKEQKDEGGYLWLPVKGRGSGR